VASDALKAQKLNHRIVISVKQACAVADTVEDDVIVVVVTENVVVDGSVVPLDVVDVVVVASVVPLDAVAADVPSEALHHLSE